CSATAFMSMASGVEATEELAGAAYVQEALATVFGHYGYIFITLSLTLFAFTTLLGNLYYVDSCLKYLNKKTPSKTFMLIYRLIAIALIFIGSSIEMEAAWNIADFLMALMVLVNIPTILVLGNQALAALKDYKKQVKAGKDPQFVARDIGIDEGKLDYWK
ncbi:MAG: alanine:cation symporter family protein, partial [Firmicutes bacterium]|nr:alanine:cation symporter family protein [Bacillota bacterium]